MANIIIDAHAKINLSLDVLTRREDGYHELKMIMQQIALKDIITIEDRDTDVIIESNNNDIPLDSSNLVYKAYRLLADMYNIKKGIYIHIQKNIPVAAGLAGGSTDAAAVLKGLNQLWNINMPQKELMDIGVKIGADVPYCLMGGTVLAEGIGEKLTELRSFSDKLILLANPDIPVSTAHVFKSLKLNDILVHPDTESLLKSVYNDDINFLAKNMANVLETITIKEHPILNDIKQHMLEYGALGSLMSGSGPTVFGIFKNEYDIQKCKDSLSNRIKTVIMTKTV
ncbi:4-(cytidine 5'-diphospho)-2-C-methyl-D-erythritol kinase [Brassicibacter mesophilus]|uniref:4-(cytidine 5'-diphospho)-2-C-methyl-D-erythritol kinase n=1 Tax=Brassicibacter mesophilus TaxID=745119 RepID=UPI003D20881F